MMIRKVLAMSVILGAVLSVLPGDSVAQDAGGGLAGKRLMLVEVDGKEIPPGVSFTLEPNGTFSVSVDMFGAAIAESVEYRWQEAQGGVRLVVERKLTFPELGYSQFLTDTFNVKPSLRPEGPAAWNGTWVLSGSTPRSPTGPHEFKQAPLNVVFQAVAPEGARPGAGVEKPMPMPGATPASPADAVAAAREATAFLENAETTLDAIESMQQEGSLASKLAAVQALARFGQKQLSPSAALGYLRQKQTDKALDLLDRVIKQEQEFWDRLETFVPPTPTPTPTPRPSSSPAGSFGSMLEQHTPEWLADHYTDQVERVRRTSGAEAARDEERRIHAEIEEYRQGIQKLRELRELARSNGIQR